MPLVVQELHDNMLKLVHDWEHVYAICPASFTADAQRRVKLESKSFGLVKSDKQCNMVWLKICMASQAHVPPSSSLFMPIYFPVPFASFRGVCVVISNHGDGVRFCISLCIKLMGGQ